MKAKKQPTESFDPKADYRSYEIIDVPEAEPTVPPVVEAINNVLSICQSERKRAFMPPARHDGGGGREKHCLHPSQLAGCARKAQFVFLNAEQDREPPNPQLERIFDIGHESHRRIQGYLFECWKRSVGGVTRVWEDVKLKIPGLIISGELDCIVEFNHIRRVVVEIKTVGKAVRERLSGPKIEWVWQSIIYAKALGLKEAFILVECRDNAEMFGYHVKVTDSIWSRIEDQSLEVICATIDKELVDPNPAPGECNFCRYKGVCKSPRVQSRIEWINVRDPS